jgi:hypothetical protein
MAGKSIVIDVARDSVANVITSRWSEWNQWRQNWLERGAEARRYVTSPDTSHTEVGRLPWRNKTVIPKLLQINDNLNAYYMAALMPNDEWMVFEGADEESRQKQDYVERYMRIKLEASGFAQELERCVADWVMYGNCFAKVDWVRFTSNDPIDGEPIVTYEGPRLVRISPIQCVVDHRAKNMDTTPFISREFVSIADIMAHNETSAEPKYNPQAIENIKSVRGAMKADWVDWFINEGLEIDGFRSWDDYIDEQNVEILRFHGDLYDPTTGKAHRNRVITIADRSWVLTEVENPAWSGLKPVAHAGWRTTPDNFYGQGPLDMLVGMQYRVDHLENLKADAYDQHVLPPIKIIGDTVEDFEFGPGAKIYTGSDGDVEFMRPELSMVSADNQIALYHAYMELFAGSPRESAGFRTPGEKTAFEVDVLQSGADRVFLHKVNKFEIFVSRVLNLMYEMMVRNVDEADISRTFKNDPDALAELGSITVEDVLARGQMVPVGAKHFAKRNRRVQEMQNLRTIKREDPEVGIHISGLKIAEILEEELGLTRDNVVEQNIGLREQMEAAVAQQQFAQNLQAIGLAEEEEEIEDGG